MTVLYFNFDPADVHNALANACDLATVTIVVTILLEIVSWETAMAAYKKDSTLYLKAVALNLLNHFVYGIPLYVVSVLLFVKEHNSSASPLVIASEVICALLVHSFCYYEVHKTFHSCPGYYKYHKFHHRFNTHVPPMSANAVGFVEYWFAYVLPFAVAAILIHPYEISGQIAAYIISMANLAIHTPKIEAWSERNMPAWLVSTHNHLEHHKKLNVKYSAPTLNVDWIVDWVAEKLRKEAATNDDGVQEVGN